MEAGKDTITDEQISQELRGLVEGAEQLSKTQQMVIEVSLTELTNLIREKTTTRQYVLDEIRKLRGTVRKLAGEKGPEVPE